MILPPPAKEDFNFEGDIRLDAENRGFTPDEMEALAGAPPPGTLAGKKGVGDWVQSIWGLDRPPEIQNLQSEFGYQSAPLLTDLNAVAEAQGTPLEGVIKARSAKYNFFLMRCGVYISPKDGENFEALKFEVRYNHDQASTYSMLPGPQANTILALGGKADMGINAKGEFGFPEVAIPGQGIAVGASVKAEIETNFIVSFQYEMKTIVVDSLGTGTSFCRWFMHKGDKLRNDVVFYPVIMTPKSVTEFECEFTAHFKINHRNWKNAEFFLKPPRRIPVST